MFYDRRGNLITIEEYTKLFANREYCEVAITELNNTRISTIWLGINHNYGEGPPLIFETMIFGGEFDQYQTRYTSLLQAVRGHELIVNAVKKGEKPSLENTNVIHMFLEWMKEQERLDKEGEEWKNG